MSPTVYLNAIHQLDCVAASQGAYNMGRAPNHSMAGQPPDVNHMTSFTMLAYPSFLFSKQKVRNMLAMSD